MVEKTIDQPAKKSTKLLRASALIAVVLAAGSYFTIFNNENTDQAIAATIGAMKINQPSDVSSPWGVYPNCIAPAVPQEVHSWWAEKGEMHPRHVHLGTCIPNAISSSNFSKVSKATPIAARIVVFNNPGVYNFTRWSDESDIKEVNTFNKNTQCQTGPDQMKECIFYVQMTLDPAKFSHSGIREIRLTPDLNLTDLGTRQFATLNYETYIDNGKSRDDSRSKPDVIGRSWYTGINYTNVSSNYETLLGSAANSIPTVKGKVSLNVCHQTNDAPGGTKLVSYLFENPDFHRYPAFHDNPVDTYDPVSGKTMRMIYKKSGLACGPVTWDTTRVSNGKNVLYMQTEDTVAKGTSASALKLFFNVAN